jgi:hypothetical protein
LNIKKNIVKKFSKEELQEQAEKFMKAHNVDSFLATEDGNFFHPNDKSLADDHNYKNVKGEVIVFGKPKAEGKTPKAKKAIPELDVDRHEEPVVEKPKAEGEKPSNAES